MGSVALYNAYNRLLKLVEKGYVTKDDIIEDLPSIADPDCLYLYVIQMIAANVPRERWPEVCRELELDPKEVEEYAEADDP